MDLVFYVYSNDQALLFRSTFHTSVITCSKFRHSFESFPNFTHSAQILRLAKIIQIPFSKIPLRPTPGVTLTLCAAATCRAT